MIEAKRAVGTESAGGPPAGVRGAGGPPPGVGGANPMHSNKSGFEGREHLLGNAVALAIKTLADSVPYQHEMNDALVKMHLTTVQFGKNKGVIADMVAHDIKTMAPMLGRMKAMIDKTGDKTIAMVGIFDRTACHYQLALDTTGTGNKREYTAPYGTVLEMGKRIGQFDMTEQEVHEIWTKPRLNGYADAMGIKLKISDIGADKKITVELVD